MLSIPQLDLATMAKDTIPYRNTLIEVTHPTARLGILKLDMRPQKERASVDLLGRTWKGLVLDVATGSRKHGCFVISDTGIGKYYWPTDVMRRVTHGSLPFTTNMAPPIETELTVRVVPDGDPRTNDCHGKIRPGLLGFFGSRDGQAIQFRLACRPWLAKGTVMYGEGGQRPDLILPLSCFKSERVPPVGLHSMQAVFGTTFLSKERTVNVSYQFAQRFSAEAIMADCRIKIDAAIERLKAATVSPKAMAELLSPETEAEFNLMEIIRSDVHDQLRAHPWVVTGMNRMLRRRWLQLATGAGLKGKGYMGLPDERLPFGTVRCSSMESDRQIAWRYPNIRPESVLLVKVVYDADVPPGAVMLSMETAAAMEGDVDGDMYCFLCAHEYAHMAAEVAEWHKSPVAPIVISATRREGVEADMPQIAYDSALSSLGRAVDLSTRAQAAGDMDAVADLAIQIQLAVSSLKHNCEPDRRLLSAMDKRLPKIPWLQGIRQTKTFLTEPLVSGPDTIGQIIAYVAPHWQPPQALSRPLVEYQRLVPYADSAIAVKAYRHYAQQVNRIMALQGEGERQRELTRVLKVIRKWADELVDPEPVLRQLWYLSHRKRDKDMPWSIGSICFQLFPGMVAELLKGPPVAPEVFMIAGLGYHDWRNQLEHLPSQAVVTVTDTQIGEYARSLASVCGKPLGVVSTETPVQPGFYHRKLIFNGQAAVYAAAL